MGGKSRFTAAIVLAVAMLAAPLAHASGTPGLQTLVLRFAHDDSGYGKVIVSGTATIAPGAFVASLTVERANTTRPTVEGSLADVDQLTAVRTFGPQGPADVCPGAPVCVVSSDGRLTFSLGASAPPIERGPFHWREYFVIRASHIKLHVDATDDWRRLASGGRVDRIMDKDSGDIGVSAATYNVAVHSHSVGHGGGGGSIALAIPPCDTAGMGSTTLTGGMRSDSAGCGDTAGGFAPGATTWRAVGQTVGVSQYATRLLIVAK